MLALAVVLMSQTAPAQTTQPQWKRTEGGDLILRPFQHAPYPHASREKGYQGKSKFFPKEGHYDDSTVGIFIPQSFSPRQRTNYIIHFHGHATVVERAMRIHRLAEQVAASKANAILIVPQGPKEASDSGCGKLELEQGGAKALLEEVGQFLLSENRMTSAALGNIVLSAHSGGYKVTGAVLDHGGITEHVTDVLLLDATYGSLEQFSAWCCNGSQRRLVSIFTDHLKDENQTLMDLFRKGNIDYLLLQEKSATPEALMQRQPIFIPTSLAHNDVPMKTDYFRRLLETSRLK